MRKINTSRYAILGALLEKPSSGYEIKALMGRSTVYFWKESDSTINIQQTQPLGMTLISLAGELSVSD